MKTFVIDFLGGDSIVVNVRDIRSAIKIAKENGSNLMKYNGISSMYFIWDENEENLLYTVHTLKCGNKLVTEITKGYEN